MHESEKRRELYDCASQILQMTREGTPIDRAEARLLVWLHFYMNEDI